jgi:inosose dehydratase
MTTEVPADTGVPGIATSGSSVRSRVAAAPISWGVCEVPDWGYQLGPERVLTEMRSLGLTATEFGPDGFLADEPVARAEQLRALGMTAVGGFLPVLLHDPVHDPLPQVDRFIDACVASGATVMVLGAYVGVPGYGVRPELDGAGWSRLLANLDRVSDHAHARGITAALHPHVGTMVERETEIVRVLDGSHVDLCVDTGHLELGGTDAVALTAANTGRVAHVHLKDVDRAMAARVVAGELAFGDAVRAGIFQPLGKGDVDIAALVEALESAGYSGWYVLEQDVMLDGEPCGEGPVAHVRASLDFLIGASTGLWPPPSMRQSR